MKYINSAGTLFVFGSYRQEFDQKSTPTQRREILRGEALIHGPYVAIVGRREAIFNADAGLAAGEYVLSALSAFTEKNIIYCEKIDDQDNTIAIVVAVNGKIVADCLCKIGEHSPDIQLAFVDDSITYTAIFSEELKKSELTGIIDFSRIKDSKVYSGVPCFKAKLSSTDKLNHVCLTSVDDALEKAGLAKKASKSLPLLLVAGLAIVAFFSYPTFQKKKDVEAQVIDPFLEYRQTFLSARSPVSALLKSIPLIHRIDTLPGWKIESLEIKGDIFRAVVLNIGGTTTAISALKDNYQEVNYGLENGNLWIAGMLKIDLRSFPYVIYPIKQIESKIFDSLAVSQQYELSVKSEVDKGAFASKQYSVSAKKVTFVQIESMAYTLINLPVHIDSISIKPVDVGYDLIITLTIFGSRG